MRKLEKIIDSIKPRKVISVGDVISRSILKSGLPLDVYIVDNRSMRKPVKEKEMDANVRKVLHLVNPPGAISKDSWRIIDEAINSDDLVKILVEGEEDLLTIVATILAPINSIVVYGQPNEGIVVIKVTREAKEKMYEILNKMIYKPEN
ncbi:GTP-dependent dephospho-CoA kinase family protein, partial [Candidatus Bathyarchaeota archaeon]|nr:GTP-dependent dephospho-CoA kinase family protein [Candidatus Bathyarchaeota archaeon]